MQRVAAPIHTHRIDVAVQHSWRVCALADGQPNGKVLDRLPVPWGALLPQLDGHMRAVVELRDADVGERHPAGEQEVDKRRDVALLGEVEARKTLARRLGLLQVAPHLSQERERGQHANLLLGLGVKAVLLRRDEVEEDLGTCVELVQPTVLLLGTSARRQPLALRVEYRKQEVAVVQRVVFNLPSAWPPHSDSQSRTAQTRGRGQTSPA